MPLANGAKALQPRRKQPLQVHMVVYKELNKPNSIGSKWFSGVLDRAHWSSNVFFAGKCLAKALPLV